MRKLVTLILPLVLLIGFLAACSQSSTEEAAGEDVTTLKFWRAGTDTLESEYWKRVIQDYEAEHSNIKIELTEVPWGTDIETKLSTAFVGNTAPDVISYSIASVAARASLGHYMPIDEYVDDWEGKDDLIDSILESGMYDGQTYGLGFIPDPRVFVWRKDYFEEAGLDPEAPPTTWEELAEYAEKLTVEENGSVVRAGYQLRNSVNNGDAAQTWQTFALQNGGQVIDAENNKATFASPEGIEAAEFLTSLVEKDVTMFIGETDPFVEGKVAMSYSNPSVVFDLLKNNPDLEGKIGYGLPIEREQKATFAGLRLLFMGSQTQHKEESWEFMKYVLSAEETWKRYEELAAPVVLESLQDRYIEEDPEVHSAIYEGVTYGQGFPRVPYSFTYMEIISRALEQSYFGEKTAEQAFKDAEKEFERQLPDLLEQQ